MVGRKVVLPSGQRLNLRSAQPADAAALQDFVRGLSALARQARFFAPVRELSPEALARLASGASGPVFLTETEAGEVVALAEYAAGEDAGTCELALVVADAWQGQGLGRVLMDRLLESAREARIERAIVDVLQENGAMLALARARDFTPARSPHGWMMQRLVLKLQGAALAAA
jgi:acetyltransferase